MINDALAKWLVASYGPFEIIFIRSLVALPMVVGFVIWVDGRAGLRSARPGVHLVRGLLAIGAAAAFILSLRTLPFAEATALIASAPLFVAALSVPILGEKVGRAQGAFIALGFAGVLLITQPGAAAFQPASLLALGASALYALVMISAKWIDQRDSPRTVMLHLTFASVLFSGIAVVPSWPILQAPDIVLFLGMAVAATLGVTLLTQAFRIAPAAVVAPFDYTALVWAGVLGWAVWNDVPNGLAVTGAALIVASGLTLAIVKPK